MVSRHSLIRIKLVSHDAAFARNAPPTSPNTLPCRIFSGLSRIFNASSQVAGEEEGEWLKFNHTKPLHHQEHTMKIMKNFEAAFVAAVVVATFASYATANESARIATAPVAASTVSVDTPMQVVVIKGQRLTAAQKAKLGA
jgi:hypothetical protein